MPELIDTIPEEYKNPNISLAAKIVSKNRSVLYRDYIKTGDISVSMDSTGKKFVPLIELQRVFGTETCAKNIKHLCNTELNIPNTLKKQIETREETIETFDEPMELRLLNARLETENEYLKKMLEEQKQQVQAAELREKRIFEELTRSQLLLENHRAKEQPASQPRSEKNENGFWQRVKAVFTG
jgi:RecG-like helicase